MLYLIIYIINLNHIIFIILLLDINYTINIIL